MPNPLLHSLLHTLRRRGIDIKSAHRRDATCPMTVQRRLLAGKSVRTIFDCGAHHGRLALEYRRAFPSAQVYCFEPTPDTFAVLQRNLAGADRVEPINAAVAAASGTLDFFIGDDEQSNSLARPAAANGAAPQVTTVKAISLGDFCRERGIDAIDILKMDVEGYELEALRGLEPMLAAQRIDVIYCEVRFEPPAPGCTHFTELAAHLRDRGYRFVGFYDSLYEPSLRYAWGDVIFASDACLARSSPPAPPARPHP